MRKRIKIRVLMMWVILLMGIPFKTVFATEAPLTETEETYTQAASLGKAEGDELFKKCYEVMKRMQDDSRWKTTANGVETFAKQDAEKYVKYVQGTTEEWIWIPLINLFIVGPIC